MHRIETGFAMEVNLSRDRRGHVFERRFPSRLVDSEIYLERVIAYVLLNPLRGGLVRSLDELLHYAWTNLPQLIGEKSVRSAVADALRPFGDSPERLVRSLASLVEDPGELDRLSLTIESQSWSSQILGSDEFGDAARKRASKHRARVSRLRHSWRIADVVSWVSLATGVPTERILSSHRSDQENNARVLIASACTSELGMSQVEIARGLRVTPMTVSRLLVRASSRGLSFSLPDEPLREKHIAEKAR
jgi:hypothetical protein